MIKQIKKNIPNALTTLRLFIALGLLTQINNPLILNNPLSILPIYMIGAGSDFLDGYLARKWQVQSTYGRRVDPLADKLLNITGLAIALKVLNLKSLYLPLIMEATIGLTTGIRALINKKTSKITQTGRLKTVLLGGTIITAFSLTKIPQLKYLFYGFMGSTLITQSLALGIYHHRYQKIAKNKKKQSPPITIPNNENKKYNQTKINEYQRLRNILINYQHQTATKTQSTKNEKILIKEINYKNKN